jgi:Uri superfamily endonuclease
MLRKGTYILIFDMPAITIKVGALGPIDIKSGTYCYVGSAMNGLDQRIGRHLLKNKKMRWHIDYLTINCSRIEAYESVNPETTECMLGKIVLKNGGKESIKGFGCSDCRCHTHLFILDHASKNRLISDPRFKPYCRQSIQDLC